MIKKTTIIIFITFFSIIQAFSQDVSEEKKSAKKWVKSLELTARPSVSLIQDKISPSLIMKLGYVSEKFKIHLVGENNYYFSNRSDNSRKRNVETYYGIEFVGKSFVDRKNRFGDKIKDKFNTENWWQGIGVSFCPNPSSSNMHLKEPIKVYWIMDFGGIGINTGYVFSDFFYPSVSIRFGF
tara:strand:+ start:205 stop:750 length:546 start_codon:yes stop_codon:yes gene_type:complete